MRLLIFAATALSFLHPVTGFGQYYYMMPQEPLYYEVDQTSDCSACQSSTVYQPSITAVQQPQSSVGYGRCKPVHSTDSYGNIITTYVPETQTVEYSVGSQYPLAPQYNVVEESYKGGALILPPNTTQPSLEVLLIAVRKAVMTSPGYRIGRASCVDSENKLDVEFVRVSDNTTGHVTVQRLEEVVELTAFIQPKVVPPPGQDTSKVKDEARDAFNTIREELANRLGIPAPPKEQ